MIRVGRVPHSCIVLSSLLLDTEKIVFVRPKLISFKMIKFFLRVRVVQVTNAGGTRRVYVIRGLKFKTVDSQGFILDCNLSALIWPCKIQCIHNRCVVVLMKMDEDGAAIISYYNTHKTLFHLSLLLIWRCHDVKTHNRISSCSLNSCGPKQASPF